MFAVRAGVNMSFIVAFVELEKSSVYIGKHQGNESKLNQVVKVHVAVSVSRCYRSYKCPRCHWF